MAHGTVNSVTLLGRLGQDPEIRETKDGGKVATLSLATNDNVKDREDTEWHRVVIFGKGAEILEEHSKKGGLLYIEGRNKTKKYEDKEGITRYSTEVIASNFQFVGGKDKD